MTYKHLLLIFSTNLILFSCSGMDVSRSKSVPENKELIAAYVCSILKIEDEPSKEAIKELLSEKKGESPQQRDQREAIRQKISLSLSALEDK